MTRPGVGGGPQEDEKTKDKLYNLVLRAHHGIVDCTAEHFIARILVSSHMGTSASFKILRNRDFPLMYQKLRYEVRLLKKVCPLL